MHYQFEGVLTARDCKRHIPHRFAVPAGSGQVEIDFRFTPYSVHAITNLITLTVFDPKGFRGAGHRDGARHQVRIGVAEATPGYLAGPLPAGEWIAQIDTHMVMPGESVHYWMDLTVNDGACAASETAVLQPVRVRKTAPRGAGWYRGDLHSHTNHSDAGARTVAELIQSARDQNLDFVFLTDHNTTAGLAEMDASVSDDLLTAGGIELTTYWGHALCLGTREWIDWRVRPNDGEMVRIAAATHAQDQVFIIAHPQSPGEPACTGCTWRFGEMMPGTARLIEIWNGSWQGDSNNEAALALWYDWLNQGLHVAATAGSDSHSAQDYADRPGFSVIYAEQLSEPALFSALRAGHLYLSADPQLAFYATNGAGGRSLIGDTVTEPVRFTCNWSNCPADAQIRLMVNGRLLDRRATDERGEFEWDMAPAQADWVVVEIRAANGELLAITNPIFLQSENSSA